LTDLPTEEDVIASLQQVEDPELGVNIVDLGLIYSIEIADHSIHVTMTMTAPGCPLTDFLEKETRRTLQTAFADIDSITVEVVWYPPWSSAMMTWRAKEQLGWVR
jgi:metal-sulfur cluster biosynthetic enzyme